MQERVGKHIGFSLYQDDKGRTVYYDRINKKGYQISKKDEKKYFLYSSRPVSAFIIGYIAYYFSHSWPISIFVALVAYLVILFFFRKLFLADLPEAPKFVPTKGDPLYVRSANMFSTSRIIVIIIIAFMLAIGTVINAITSNYESVILILNYALAAGAFVFGLFYIYVLIYKLKNK